MAANVCLLIALAGLGVWNVRTWTHPPYPDRIDGETVRPPPRDPPENLVDRKAYSANAISGVTQNNLFQEERRSFFVQPAPRPANVAAAVPKVPPPNLTPRGVVRLDGKELALLEGTYPVAQPKNRHHARQRQGRKTESQTGEVPHRSTEFSRQQYRG